MKPFKDAIEVPSADGRTICTDRRVNVSEPIQLPLRFLFEQLYNKVSDDDKLSVMGVSDNSHLDYVKHLKDNELSRV